MSKNRQLRGQLKSLYAHQSINGHYCVQFNLLSCVSYREYSDYECAVTNICIIKSLLLPSLVIHNLTRKYWIFVHRNNMQRLIVEHAALLREKTARRSN